jgi:hypothetical protein
MHDEQERYTAMIRIVNGVFLVKTIIGSFLLLMGCIFAFRILAMVFSVIRSPIEIALVHRLSQIGKEGAAISIFGETLTISPATFAYGNIIISYTIVIILLAIGAGLVKAFLYAGSNLVQSGIETFLDKLGEELLRLWRYRGRRGQDNIRAS